MDRRAAGLAMAGYALLLVGWLAATPPYHAPDEVAHVVRAYGLGEGQLVGGAPRYLDPPPDVAADPAALARYDWTYETTTLVEIPPVLDPIGRDCTRDPRVPAACADQAVPPVGGGARPTNTGTTTPAAVGLPALVMRPAGDAGAAVVLGRLGQLASTLVALGLVVTGLRPAGAAGMAGLALAATPMVLYVGVVVNPSGPEVWGTLACLVASWRMLDPDRRTRGWVWMAAATAVALPLTRQPGIVWALIALGGAVGLRSRAGLLPLLRGRWRSLGLFLGALVVGAGGAAAWNAVVAVRTPLRVAPLGGDLARVGREVPNLLRQVVGEVNVLESALPAVVYRTWLLGIAVAVLLAVGRAGRRWWVPLLPIGGVVAFTLGFWLLSYRFTGFGLQGRHVLPAVVLVPLVACLALAGTMRRDRRPSGRAETWLAPGATVLLAVLHVVAWAATARRFAVGVEGPLAFWRAPLWDPAGGWLPWLAVVAVGAALLAAAGVVAGAAAAASDGLGSGRRIRR